MSPIKRERENPGRIKLEKGEAYVLVCATERKAKRGKFFLSIYFDQRLRDVECKRVYLPDTEGVKNPDGSLCVSVLPQFIPEEAEKIVS